MTKPQLSQMQTPLADALAENTAKGYIPFDVI